MLIFTSATYILVGMLNKEIIYKASNPCLIYQNLTAHLQAKLAVVSGIDVGTLING